MVIFAIALRALQVTLAGYRWRDFIRNLSSLPGGQVVLAVVLAFAGYLIMTGYDTFAFRYIDRSLPYRRIALASFIAYAINNNLGLSGVVGTSLRYRFYSRWGLGVGEITRVFVFCTSSYWLGFLLLGGSVFLFRPPPVPEAAHLAVASIRMLGAVLLVLGLSYFLWLMTRRKPIRLRQWEIALPAPSVLIGQVVISIADWTIAGAVLHALIPMSAPISFVHVLGVFLLAQIGGLVSNVPGGLGVFDAIVLALLTQYFPPTDILAVLVAFRGIYLVLPLLVAILLLACHLLRAERSPFPRTS